MCLLHAVAVPVAVAFAINPSSSGTVAAADTTAARDLTAYGLVYDAWSLGQVVERDANASRSLSAKRT